MIDILSIGGDPIFDNRIIKSEYHTYNPYANTTFNYSDEIRIPIQQQDLYILPCESYIYIEGKIIFPKDSKATESSIKFTNNCITFMFDEIRYELDGVEIDKNRNVGITSTIKNYISLTKEKGMLLQNAGWNLNSNSITEDFNFCVPLYILLGFCEDFKHIIINARHELILIRARNDNNCIITNTEKFPSIQLFKIQWRMPHISLNEITKLSLLKTLESGRYLSIGFRSWDLYEFPMLQNTTKHTWAVKSATQLEKPRYIIFALQTNKRNIPSQDVSKFDNCSLTNIKVFLNSDFYPYDDMNLNFNKNRFAVLYDMYSKFRKSYYGNNTEEALLTISQFQDHGPLIIIDCSRQNEMVKTATVDVRIEFECQENIPNNTTAYCLIIHDRIIEYNPLTNIVRKLV